MLVTLSITSGMFDGLLVTTRDCYPEYYAYFEPYRSQADFWDGYWTGYYEAYYEQAGWDWYTDEFAVAEPFSPVPAEQFNLYQDVTVEQIVETNVQAIVQFDALPNEDLSTMEVPPLPEGMAIGRESTFDEAMEPRSAEQPAPAEASDELPLPDDGEDDPQPQAADSNVTPDNPVEDVRKHAEQAVTRTAPVPTEGEDETAEIEPEHQIQPRHTPDEPVPQSDGLQYEEPSSGCSVDDESCGF